MFETTDMKAGDILVFYRGSYKAYFEVFETMKHMEALIRRAVKNPLARVAKIGLLG